MDNGTTEPQAAETPKKPKLTRLKIESFRNVAPCELRFGDGFNVLLGLNATGKTTLLELIVAAVSFDFSKFRNEAFAVEYDLSFSTGTISASIRNERIPTPPLEAPELQLRDAEVFVLLARLHIRFTSPSEAWTVRADGTSIWIEERPHYKPPLRSHSGNLLSEALRIDYNEALLHACQKELDFLARVPRFDETLDLFQGITSPSTWVEVHAKGAGFLFRIGGLVPAELLKAAGMQVAKMSGDTNQGLTIASDSLGFLEKAAALFGVKTARLEMRLDSKVGGFKYNYFRFMFEDHDGSVLRHDDLSYGQKRLLAFYYYLASSPMTVIADELVNGFHHLWIDAAIKAIGDRQAFLASQNPLLLDHLEFASAEEVASTFITCRIERSGDDKRMIWSNLSEYDAERFFRAYQVDVQHVSEILLSKSLW
jgi:hypothetical protein